MSKISLEQVEATLLEKKIDRSLVSSIILDLAQSIEEEKADKEPKKKETWEHLVFLNKQSDSDPTGGRDAWVVVYKEGVDAGTVLDKIRSSAVDQNEVASKKKAAMDNLGEVFQNLKPKFLKDKSIKIKTKESVRVIEVDGTKF
jgi:hypothetical protein